MKQSVNTVCKIIIVMLLVGSFTAAQAQIHLAPAVSFNINNMNFDPKLDPSEGDVKWKTGFGAGLIATFPLNDRFALQVEPMFMQRGVGLEGSENDGGDTYSIKQNIRLSFIDVPVLVRAAFGSGNLRPYIAAGPYAGYLLSAKAKIDEARFNGQPVDGFEGQEEDVKDDLKSFDFGLNFGGGLSIPAGRGNLMVEALYNLGLSNLEDSGDNTEAVSDARNRGVMVKAAYSFPIGRR